MNDTDIVLKPETLVISRNFPASPETVFRAWTSAEHLKNWFSPEHCSVPEADIECRAGGKFVLCMRLPDETESWCRGHFTEVLPPERLAFSTDVEMGGARCFTSHTTVTFIAEGTGTCITVRQDYEVYDAAFRPAREGAMEGWRTTLDKLAREVARIDAAQNRSVVHAIFSIERTYDAAPATVFRALTDPQAKARWFTGGDAFTALERSMDLRPGGRERLRGRWADGTQTLFDAVYFDVIANERLVYAYEMHIDDRRISVSLATLELTQAECGTRLKITEQGAFLDGYDDNESRKHGTGQLLDRLGASL